MTFMDSIFKPQGGAVDNIMTKLYFKWAVDLLEIMTFSK